MDSTRFAAFARALTAPRSRRGALATLLGATAGLLGLADLAASRGKKKRRKKKGNCRDGIKNGSETAVDCGGRCSRCAVGKRCRNRDDCASAVCANGSCQECVTEDAMCGRDADGVTCFCKAPDAGGPRVCITGNATGSEVDDCGSCPAGTHCITIGDRLLCFKPCSASKPR